MRITEQQLRQIIKEELTQAKLGISSPFRSSPDVGVPTGTHSCVDCHSQRASEDECPECGSHNVAPKRVVKAAAPSGR